MRNQKSYQKFAMNNKHSLCLKYYMMTIYLTIQYVIPEDYRNFERNNLRMINDRRHSHKNYAFLPVSHLTLDTFSLSSPFPQHVTIHKLTGIAPDPQFQETSLLLKQVIYQLYLPLHKSCSYYTGPLSHQMHHQRSKSACPGNTAK